MNGIKSLALVLVFACSSATPYRQHLYEPLGGIEVKAKAVKSLPEAGGVPRWLVTTARNEFTIGIADDPRGERRKALLSEIARYWRAKSPEYIAEYQKLPGDKSVVRYKTHYLLYSIDGSTTTIHDGRDLIRISGDSPSAVADFIRGSVAFRVGDEKVIEVVLEPFSPMALLAGVESGEIR